MIRPSLCDVERYLQGPLRLRGHDVGHSAQNLQGVPRRHACDHAVGQFIITRRNKGVRSQYHGLLSHEIESVGIGYKFGWYGDGQNAQVIRRDDTISPAHFVLLLNDRLHPVGRDLKFNKTSGDQRRQPLALHPRCLDLTREPVPFLNRGHSYRDQYRQYRPDRLNPGRARLPEFYLSVREHQADEAEHRYERSQSPHKPPCAKFFMKVLGMSDLPADFPSDIVTQPEAAHKILADKLRSADSLEDRCDALALLVSDQVDRGRLTRDHGTAVLDVIADVRTGTLPAGMLVGVAFAMLPSNEGMALASGSGGAMAVLKIGGMPVGSDIDKMHPELALALTVLEVGHG